MKFIKKTCLIITFALSLEVLSMVTLENSVSLFFLINASYNALLTVIMKKVCKQLKSLEIHVVYGKTMF